MQRLQRHHHLDGRAVGHGDDVLFRVARQRLRIDLRHDQRDVGVHAELAGFIDDDGAGLRGARREFGRNLAAGGGENKIHPLEIELGEVLNLEVPVAERDFLAHRARRRQRDDIVDGKFPLMQNAEHLMPDIARGAHYRNPVCHSVLS